MTSDHPASDNAGAEVGGSNANDPDTPASLYHHSDGLSVAPEDLTSNGLCTLTQSFEGSDNGITATTSATQTFRVHTFLAEPITSEMDQDGHVYNPSGIPVGGTARFKVSLDPMTGFTENDITWQNLTLSVISFVDDVATGSEITVQGDVPGDFFLMPEVEGMRLDPFPAFHGKVMTPTSAPVTVWIVRDNNGGDAPISMNDIPPLIADANKILRQKALTLDWSGTANYTNRYEWQHITDVMNPTNTALNALLDCSQNTGGVEIYFVKTLNGGPETRGYNSDHGLVLAEAKTARTLAHEVLHQCGLVDVYSVFSEETSLVVSGAASCDRLPYDWGNGWYRKSVTQSELIERLAMNGLSNFEDEGIDLPSGPVYGLGYAFDSQSGTNTWFLGLRSVGQNGISSQTPAHQ